MAGQIKKYRTCNDYGMLKVETESDISTGIQTSGHDPIQVSVCVNGRQVMMEIETSAGHTIAREDTDLWGPDMLPLQPPDVGLHTHTGESGGPSNRSCGTQWSECRVTSLSGGW